MKFVISGYYGFNNSGDDTLLLSIVNGIKNMHPNADITVLSKNPKATRNSYGVNAVNRYNIFLLLWSIFKCDCLISGGGTLIQDETSTKSLLYYLFVIKAATFFKKKVMLYANGIGPLNSFQNIEKTRVTLDKVDLITIRDESSLKELEHIGVTKPKIELTADPAFLLEKNSRGPEVLENYNVPKNTPYICVSVRDWKNNPKNFEDIIAEFCDYAFEKYNLYTVLIPMQHSVDFDISVKIKGKMKNRSTVIGSKFPIETVLSVIFGATACVGMRLHSLIYSASCIVPTIGIVYDPKISGFMDYMNEKHYFDVEAVDTEKLNSTLDEVMGNYDAIKSHIKFNIRNLRKKAAQNNEFLDELLGGKQ